MYRVEQKKSMPSVVKHVPSGLMGCASAALGQWVGGRRGNSNKQEFLGTALYSLNKRTHNTIVDNIVLILTSFDDLICHFVLHASVILFIS